MAEAMLLAVETASLELVVVAVKEAIACTRSSLESSAAATREKKSLRCALGLLLSALDELDELSAGPPPRRAP